MPSRPRYPMPETPSTVVDLGNHALEVTQDGRVLIAAHPVEGGPVPVIQLESSEVYKLFITLQALFS